MPVLRSVRCASGPTEGTLRHRVYANILWVHDLIYGLINLCSQGPLKAAAARRMKSQARAGSFVDTADAEREVNFNLLSHVQAAGAISCSGAILSAILRSSGAPCASHDLIGPMTNNDVHQAAGRGTRRLPHMNVLTWPCSMCCLFSPQQHEHVMNSMS